MAEPTPSFSSPSLPRVGDVVEGHYKILRAKEWSIRVEYEVLDIQTGGVSSKHYSLTDRYAHSHLPELKHYQIEEIAVKSSSAGLNPATVTLALLQRPQGKKVEGGGRMFKLEDKGKIRTIRDALEKGDQDVYCTVAKLGGVEFLEDVRSLPKGPPILKVPEDIMSMICDHLEDRDLYSLRLVSSAFAKRYLPLHKMWTITELDFGLNTDGMSVVMVRKNSGNNGQRRVRDLDVEPRLDFTDGAYEEFLRTTKTLRMILNGRITEEHENSSKLLSLLRSSSRMKVERMLFYCSDHSLISQLIFANRSTLKSFSAVDDSDFDFTKLSCCKALETVEIRLPEWGMVLNLESLITLKDTLKCLDFNGLKEPLGNDQLIWISENLPNLLDLKLDVLHHCYKMNYNEVNELTILSIFDGKELRNLTLRLGGGESDLDEKRGNSKSGRPRYCGKTSKIMKEVMRILEKRKSSESKWKSELSELSWVCKHPIRTCHSFLSFVLEKDEN